MPGTVVGNFTKEIQEEVGFDCTVVLPATHDTGSAVLAVPTNDDNAIYISSGTWSLMGIERKEADCSEKSCEMIVPWKVCGQTSQMREDMITASVF